MTALLLSQSLPQEFEKVAVDAVQGSSGAAVSAGVCRLMRLLWHALHRWALFAGVFTGHAKPCIHAYMCPNTSQVPKMYSQRAAPRGHTREL